MSESHIVTGQYVHINQTVASVGERIVAQVIDLFLIFCYVVGLLVLLSKLDFMRSGAGYFYYFFLYLPALFYSFFMEVFNHGQSVGKMVMRIRVVKKDGTTPGLGDFFMRWLLGLVDMGFSGVGLLVMLLTQNTQRIGDLAAGTLVIRLNNYRHLQVSLDEFDYLDPNYRPVYPQAEELSLNQIDVIQRALDSSEGPDRERRIAALAAKVRRLLAINDPSVTDEKLLYTLLRDYRHYALEMV